jgi:mediator of RNA polymerase II transcription subunit 4
MDSDFILFFLFYFRDLFETLFANKRLRPAPGHNLELKQIADLLIAKDNQLKGYLKLAQEQEKNKAKMDSLILELNKEEEEINSFQKSLKEAEHILV